MSRAALARLPASLTALAALAASVSGLSAVGHVPLAAGPASAAPARSATAPRPHAEGPPLGHTGGGGEPTCVACHFGAALNAPGGRLTIEGVPARYTPGATYALTVALDSEGMGRAGFELGARTAGGGMGGRFAAPEPRVAVRDSAGLSWAHHTRAGSEVASHERATWSVVWTAPDVTGAGPVTLAAAANSANGDDSPFDDLIYTAALEVPEDSRSSASSTRR